MKKLLIILIGFMFLFNSLIISADTFGQSTTSSTTNQITLINNDTELFHNNMSGKQGGIGNEFYHIRVSWFNELASDIFDWITKAEADTYYAPINEPFWTGNLSNFTFVYTYAINDTNFNSTGLIKDWNATGLIKDFNVTGLIKDWNSTGYIKNWQVEIGTSNTSLYDWIVAQGYTAGALTWDKAVNGTLYLSTNPFGFYNVTTDPIYLNDTFRQNYSVYLTKPFWSEVMNGTVTSGFYNVGNAPIYLNDTFRTNYSAYLSYLNYHFNNTFSYYNSTTSPIYLNDTFRANYSVYLTKPIWSDVMNGTVTSGLPIYLNDTFRNNYSNFTTAWHYATNFTYPIWLNDTFRANYSSYLSYLNYHFNNSFNYYNSSNAPIYKNDTFRNNYSNFTTGWLYATNYSYPIYLNDTFRVNYSAYLSYLNYHFNNSFSYYNSTTIPQYLTSETLWNNNYSTYLTKPIWSEVMNGTVVSDIPIYKNDTFRNNYSNFTTGWLYGTNATQWYQVMNGTVTSDIPIYKNDTFRNNYSNFTTGWHYATNFTYPIYKNDTFRDNYSNYTTGWHYAVNGSIGWSNVINGTLWSTTMNGTLMNQSWYNTNYTNWKPLINVSWYETNYTNFRPLINSSGNNLSWYETNYTNFRPLINVSWFTTNYTSNDPVYRSFSLNYSNFTTGWLYATNSTLSWANAVNGTLMNNTWWNSNYTTNQPKWKSFADNYSNFTTGWHYATNSTYTQATYNTNYTNFRPLINVSWYETNYTNFRPLINISWFTTNYTSNDPVYRSFSLNYSNYTTGWLYGVNATQWTQAYNGTLLKNNSAVYIKTINFTESSGSCDLTLAHSYCVNSTGTYIVG